MGSESSSRSSTEVRIGAVGRPHGKDGGFVVAEPSARLDLLEPGRTVRIGERELTIAWRKGTAARPLLKLEGVDGREVRGQAITVPREALGALGAGEFLVDDLIAAEVVDGERRIGRVRNVLLMPSADLLEVDCGRDEPLLVPLVGDAVRSIDVDAGRIEIDAGFLDPDAA